MDAAALRRRGVLTLAAAVSLLSCDGVFGAIAGGGGTVPILVYHRFGPVVADAMTVTTATFEWQLSYLDRQGYVVVPLRQLVDSRLGKGPAPSARAVVLTADDGHRSVYTEMWPLVRRSRAPVTLFVYPSAISRAAYALTWEQLRELQATGLFDVQSHGYWHPNFKVEKRRLAPEEYQRLVRTQFEQSRAALQARLGVLPDMLAWPFGIFDSELIGLARTSGFVAGFTIERRHARATDDLLALPRYLVTDRDRGAAFTRLLSPEPAGHGER